MIVNESDSPSIFKKNASVEELELLSEFLKGCIFKDGAWDHKAHLLFGFYFVMHYKENAAQMIKEFFFSHDKKLGIPGSKTRYHETLTCFWVHMIERTIVKLRIQNFSKDSIQQILSSCLINSSLPYYYYSKDFLFSDLARDQFCPPDNRPFLDDFSIVK